ncbi:LOW QUALITY PROTEIN: uncharacterized protein LOC132789585 [Drosophila nasuta]|uniref:LOW QUALITY PROTEIN: uncharacterized protein LOC132789585 n=1 Tax=Drosophila nasuta TaxID=42062 RepID=UPI00295EE143|nr:LOW QUALITY PROTEIN: uncharacterized protein LOC132789585 [Drosophila nasuta]
MCRLLFILIFHCTLWIWITPFAVHFQESYPSYRLSSDLDAESMRLHKRDMQQFFDKASYSFNGLVRIASVPVPFPLDICMLQLPTVKYATALHKDATGERHFAVYVWREAEKDYALLHQQAAPKAVALDCLSYAGLGYVALSYNHTEHVDQASDGSPIYELSPDRSMRTVQYFAELRLRGMYLRISSQELTLLQAYEADSSSKRQQRCPYFKWNGGTFRRLGSIPCNNARRLEAFGIDFADFVAVGNYANANGRTSTYSEIYKYDVSARRFELFQRLRSNGAVDVKYFSLPVNEVSRRHFLILGNTVAGGGNGIGRAKSGTPEEADTVIYVYDKGQFVPYQRLSFYALERFLPVTHVISEKFLLLVACNKQDVKIYNLNDWKFEESTVQFTEGALSRGVARMRSYVENEQSYLVIANENMAANETNIFQPLYKQDEHANVLRQEIIDWAREQTKRLENLNVDRLFKALQKKLKDRKQKVRDMHVKRVNTKSFVDVKQHLSTNYWDALRYAKRALDLLDQHVAEAQHQTVKRSVKSQQKTEHKFDEITVGTLLVHEKLQAKRINGVNPKNPTYELVKADNVYVSENLMEATGEEQQRPVIGELNLQELQIHGSLNGLNWTQLLEQTLKRRGSEVQFIKAHVDISNLKAEAIMVNSNEINDRPVSQLISIDGGDYIVQQDVQFAQPIEVNKLQINQRLNQIHVNKQTFDVLLHEANHTQIIEGAKQFENIQVLEPITIAGQLLGAELRAMSPMKVTHQTVQLQGDFVINADVTIGQLLQVQDLLEASNSVGPSTAMTLQQALRVDQQLDDINLRFEKQINANDTQLSFINALDLQQLVQLNVDEVQVVEGAKLWPQSLTILKGFGEVNILNGIAVDQLSQQLLLKSSNQSLRFPMQLSSIDVPQLNATELQLNQLKFDDYMRRTGDQHINSNLYVNELHADQVNVQQLHMHGTLFGHHLEELYEQGAQRLRSWQLPSNFNGTIHARNVWLKGHINNVSITQLEQQLQQLAGNIKYVGDFTFRHPVNISELSFSGSLNGIQAQRFGHCWLETSGDQQFTARQTVAGVASEQNVVLQGKLNNYTLEQLVGDTYRLNGSEQLKAVKFVNPIVLSHSINVKRVNGLQIPEDMMYTQVGGFLPVPVQINGNLVASSQLCNVSNLNGFHLPALSRYLSGDAALNTLHVEQAQFGGIPHYETLNGRRLENVLNEIWLNNEHVELKGVQLDNASFEGLLEFEGTLNGLHVEHIGQNYFSRTRSQRLDVPISFEHDVTFAQPLAVKQVQLLRVKDGALVEGIGNGSLDLNDFVSNTLKTAGLHNITRKWNIPDAIVLGDLNNVLINQLNLVDDVLRNDTNEVSVIGAPKTVETATIQRLFATNASTVAKVPVAQWINDSVYIYGNHSIPGKTMIYTLNLYNDLEARGTVNGIRWQSDELLLCDQAQQIAGSLLIDNTLPHDNRILSNNIKELWVDQINGLMVEELLKNKAHNRPNLHVAGQLIFTKPLAVANYELGEMAANGNKWKRGASSNAVEDWQQLGQHVAAVHQRLKEPSFVLENFKLLQQIPLNATQVEVMSQNTLAIWHTNSKGVQQVDSFEWHETDGRFRHNPNASQLKLLTAQEKWRQRFGHLADNSTYICLLQMQSLDCLATQSANESLVIQCLGNDDSIESQHVISTRKVKQLVTVANNKDSIVALHTYNAVELWRLCTNGSSELQQRLPLTQAKQIAVARHQKQNYLAILTASPAAGIHIYRSDNFIDFQLEQVFDLDATSEQQRHLSFMQLQQSQDLLLCLSNASPMHSLRIYQYNGIAGFQQILGDTTLPVAKFMKPIEMHSKRHQQLLLMLVNDEHGIYVVAPQFTRL